MKMEFTGLTPGQEAFMQGLARFSRRVFKGANGQTREGVLIGIGITYLFLQEEQGFTIEAGRPMELAKVSDLPISLRLKKALWRILDSQEATMADVAALTLEKIYNAMVARKTMLGEKSQRELNQLRAKYTLPPFPIIRLKPQP